MSEMTLKDVVLGVADQMEKTADMLIRLADQQKETTEILRKAAELVEDPKLDINDVLSDPLTFVNVRKKS